MSPKPDPRRIDALLEQALDRHADERSAFLDAACGGDAELRAAVEELLRLSEADGSATDLDVLREGPFWRALVADLLEGQGLAPGTRVGAYRVVHEIARGGMGMVYLAERADGEFEAQVALKVLPGGPVGEHFLHRFERERRILAGLSHPGIARLLDGGRTADGRPYFVMEYVPGRSIDRWCDERRLDVDARLDLFAQVAEAVEYAHHNLVIHRDLKPANIVVGDDGRAKLLDFGIAALLESSGSTATVEAERYLTPEIASPEQLRGEPVTTASDVYQLGLLLYELLTGVPLGPAASSERRGVRRPSEVVSEAGDAVPAARRTTRRALRRRLRRDLDDVLLAALEQRPERRYGSVDLFARDLANARAGLPVSARPPTRAYRARRFVGRHPLGVAAAAALVVLLAGYAVTASVQQRRIAREAQRSERTKDFLASIFNDLHPGRGNGRDVTARELLDRGVERARTELRTEPELRSEVLTTFGWVLQALGHYDDSSEALRIALEARREVYGPRDPRVADTLHALGQSAHYAGRLREADGYLREALEIRRSSRMRRDPVLCFNLADLGDLLHSLGELAAAEAVLREALVTCDWPDGAQDPTLRARQDLANVLRDRGELATAIALYREVETILLERLGERDLQLLITRMELSEALTRSGRPEQARELLDRVYQAQSEIYSGEHPLLGTTLRYQAEAWLRAENLPRAREALDRALAMYRAWLGERHHLYPRAVALDAELLLAERGPEAAIARAREALDGFRRCGIPEHPAALDARRVLGAALFAAGRPREAEAELRGALVVERAKFVAGDPRVRATQELLERCAAGAETPATLGPGSAAEIRTDG